MADQSDTLLRIIPDAYLQGVGLVVTQWSWTESLLDQYIWRMLGVRALRGRIVTANLQARLKIEMLAALLRKSKFDEKFVRELEDEGKTLANLRNLVAHGSIVVNPNQEAFGMISSFAARGELHDRSCLITAPILRQLARRTSVYLQFLVDNSTRLPKQRGLRPTQASASPKTPRLRPETIAKRLPLPLQVERQKGPSASELEAARAAKRQRKTEHARRSRVRDPHGRSH